MWFDLDPGWKSLLPFRSGDARILVRQIEILSIDILNARLVTGLTLPYNALQQMALI